MLAVELPPVVLVWMVFHWYLRSELRPVPLRFPVLVYLLPLFYREGTAAVARLGDESSATGAATTDDVATVDRVATGAA